MAESYQLNTAWLGELANAHHDGTTQQIDGFVQSFSTTNARFLEKAAAVANARQKEDVVWMKSQRDDAVAQLEAADKLQDSYVSAARYIITAHAGLPDSEPTKAEAVVCAQVFKDYNFRTNEAYGAESDKIIQMQQNLQVHQTFLTQIGAWAFYLKAVEQAQQVRSLLGERALTKGEFVKGEMKSARRATDVAIADLYKTILAMLDLIRVSKSTPASTISRMALHLTAAEAIPPHRHPRPRPRPIPRRRPTRRPTPIRHLRRTPHPTHRTTPTIPRTNPRIPLSTHAAHTLHAFFLLPVLTF